MQQTYPVALMQDVAGDSASSSAGSDGQWEYSYDKRDVKASTKLYGVWAWWV